MNLKERIELINQIKSDSYSDSIEIKHDVDVSTFFVKNSLVEQILKNAVTKEKNIIILCPSSIDRTLASNYIRNFISNNISIEVLKNIADNLPFATAEKLIIPEPSFSEVVKIFELILCDFRTFVFSMHLKSFENVLESFRTILALNNPNLTVNNVEHLIGIASPVFVYIDRNEDGLFNVTDIGKVIYKNNCAFLDILYSSSKNEIQQESVVTLPQVENDEELVEEKQEEVVVEYNVPSNINIELEQGIDEKEPVVSSEVQESVVVSEAQEPPVKINKYKLLKEKVKNKKQ